MRPYFTDGQVALWHGHAADVLNELDAGNVDCVVTSPPYFGLRDYGIAPTEWPVVDYTPMPGVNPVTVPAQICPLGHEPDVASYVAHLMLVLRAVHRVLARDGVAWLNLGDSYGKQGVGVTKSLHGVPWRVALAAQSEQWIVRNDVVWHKTERNAGVSARRVERPLGARLSARETAELLFRPDPDPGAVETPWDRKHDRWRTQSRRPGLCRRFAPEARKSLRRRCARPRP